MAIAAGAATAAVAAIAAAAATAEATAAATVGTIAAATTTAAVTITAAADPPAHKAPALPRRGFFYSAATFAKSYAKIFPMHVNILSRQICHILQDKADTGMIASATYGRSSKHGSI